jgi:hypothetical protein
VPAVDLVGRDTQALSRQASDEGTGEQAVMAAEQHLRGDIGLRRKRRWLRQPCLGLPLAPPQRPGRQLRGNVLIEERDVVLVPLLHLRVPRVRPVVGRRFLRCGDRAGIIGAIRTRSLTGTRSHTSGGRETTSPTGPP